MKTTALESFSVIYFPANMKKQNGKVLLKLKQLKLCSEQKNKNQEINKIVTRTPSVTWL